jgi:hypothetical protein
MKKLFLIASMATFSFLSAQDLPAPSPAAELEQRVGLTDVKINYSRPQMKGREIFGKLVPFDKLWRTGANKITSIEFSTDVMFNKMPVKAGKYSLITIPSETKWTVILNRETEMWGIGNYDKSKDVVRTMISAEKLPKTVETFTIEMENLTSTSAHLAIKWENTSVSVPITVSVDKQAEINIAKAVEEDGDNWRVHRNAASYYVEKGKNYDKALEHMNKAIELDPNNWYSHWVKAEVLHGLKRNKEAKELAMKAIAMGEAEAKKEGNTFTYGDGLKAEMAEW